MRLISLFLLLIIFISCENDLPEIIVPELEESTFPDDAIPVPDEIKFDMEGIYKVEAGSSRFGHDAVLKWSGDYLSVFTGKSATYLILQSAYKDSTVYLEGYWRAATSSETGLAVCYVDVCNPDSLVMSGFYGNGSDFPGNNISLEYDSPFAEHDTAFYIIGHRGGGRNVDRLPYSENSIEMIKFAQRLGANAIEIDVKRTKDGVPVLFHDKFLNKRLINEDYFIGEISDYTFAQLRTFCTLINGEQIPSLEEALQVVVEETELSLVWLDIKDARLIEPVAQLQQQYLELAGMMGRDVEILIGIPDDEVLDEFMEFEDYENIPSLCELQTGDAVQSNARIWAPRWSLGLLNEKVDEMHGMGKKVFIWTLDDKVLISRFIVSGNFDGFVTNYPSLTAYEYYRRK